MVERIVEVAVVYNCAICKRRCRRANKKTCSPTCHSEYMRRLNEKRHANPEGASEPSVYVSPKEIANAAAAIKASQFSLGKLTKRRDS